MTTTLETTTLETTTLESALTVASGEEFVDCPECGAPARVTRRDTVYSTDGPVEQIGLRCGRHFLLMPTSYLDAPHS